MQLLQGDCLELLKGIPDGSVDLALCDPPYNIGKADWDRIPNYIAWSSAWLKECDRALTETGSLYFWHNDLPQIADLMQMIKKETSLLFRQFCIWVKPNHRKKSWGIPSSKNTLRNWFNICEYCLYYVKSFGALSPTGLERINSNPERYKPLKEWYAGEKRRLGITDRDISKAYTKATGKKPYMLRHYFQNSQFGIPVREVYEAVYEPLGFRKKYEALRQEYEALRPVHRLDNNHGNVWISKQITGSESVGKNHMREKPVDILERIIQTSSRQGGVVLDCFMGSGSTGVACVNTGRDFIGMELDPGYFEVARKRIAEAQAEASGGQG